MPSAVEIFEELRSRDKEMTIAIISIRPSDSFISIRTQIGRRVDGWFHLWLSGDVQKRIEQ